MSKKHIVSLNTAKDVLLSDLLSMYYYGDAHKGLVNYIEGTMGIGKSSIFRQLKTTMQKITGVPWGFIDWRLAAFTASDLQGVPFPTQVRDIQAIKWLKDMSLPGIGDYPPNGIFVLDEVNQVSDQSVASLLYQLILDYRINDYNVPPGWIIFCAGNREEDGGSYNRILAPVRDRVSILEVNLPTKEWLEHAKENSFHIAVVSFINERDANGKNVLHTYNPKLEADGDEKCENYVFATPRSWEEVSKELYKHEIMLQQGGEIVAKLTRADVLEAKICGKIGEDLGKEFFTYYGQTRDIPVHDIFSAEWVNNEPSIKIQRSLKKQQDTYYITSLMPTLSTADKRYKLLAYAAYVGVPDNTYALLISNLSAEEQRGFVNYMEMNNCQRLLMSAAVQIPNGMHLERV